MYFKAYEAIDQLEDAVADIDRIVDIDKGNRTFLMEHFNSKKIWNSHLERIHFSGPDNVLSVFGSKDKTTPKTAFMYLVKKLNASYTIYEGSGHNDIITAPKYNDKFVKEIILFADNV